MIYKHGGPAFPTPDDWSPAGDLIPGGPGMTLRDHFAGQAMQAVLASADDAFASFTYADRSVFAYQQADAMLEARK